MSEDVRQQIASLLEQVQGDEAALEQVRQRLNEMQSALWRQKAERERQEREEQERQEREAQLPPPCPQCGNASLDQMTYFCPRAWASGEMGFGRGDGDGWSSRNKLFASIYGDRGDFVGFAFPLASIEAEAEAAPPLPVQIVPFVQCEGCYHVYPTPNFWPLLD